MPNAPEAIIGLKLDSVGIDQAASGAENLAGHLSNVTKEISTIGVGIGVGGLLRDFVAIEGSAARTASYMGSITGGMSGYSGLAQSALGVQARTGIAASQTLGAAAMIASLTGGRGLAGNPAAQAGLLGALGTYGAAYQVNPTELASSLGPLLQSAGLSGAAGKPMLNMLAGNAYAGGMGNNFPSYLAGVGSMATSAVATNPGLSKFGGAVAGGLSTMYNQAAAGNPAYLNNPSLFQSGETAVSGALQGAYQNPRMTLALESMGINYWDARQGLAGPQGQANAAKILKYSAEQFGEGTTYQDAWLRANFGELNGTEALKAIAAGKKGGAGAASASQRWSAQGAISQRAAQGSTTPGANLERARGGIEHGVFGAVGGALNGLFGLQAESPFGALAGSYAAMKLLGKSGSIFSKLLGGGGAEETGAGGLGALLGGGIGFGALGSLGTLAVGGIAAEVGAHGFGSILEKITKEKQAKSIGELLGGTNEHTDEGEGHLRGMQAHEGSAAVNRVINEAAKKFGPGFYHMDKGGEKANKWMRERMKHLLGGGYALESGMKSLDTGIGNMREYGELGAQGYAQKKFGDSVTEFGQYVKSLKGSGNKNTSYLSSMPGNLNAAGLQNVSDIVGHNMAEAHNVSLLSMGGGGSSVAIPAVSMGSGGGSSSTSGAPRVPLVWPVPSGYYPCTLTYYQPSAGGINGKSGGGAWSGHPVTNSTWGCAAPPQFAFGTQIEFAYGGKQVTVTVVDRGGAITGTHFDLLPGPARALGMMGAGVVTGGYKIVKCASNSGSSGGGSAQGSGGASIGSLLSSASVQSAAYSGVMGSGAAATAVHVHIDGRQIERQRRLVRGKRA